MKAKDLMTENPLTASSTDSIWGVGELMLRADVRHIPILEDGELIGMLSDRDLRSYDLPYDEATEDPAAALERLDTPVGEIFETNLISVEANASAAEVIDLMLEARVGAIPVVESDTQALVGIISYVDILKAVRDKV